MGLLFRRVFIFIFILFPIFTSLLNTASAQLPLLFRLLFHPGAVQYWYDIVPLYCASWVLRMPLAILGHANTC
jgi:hypothetical protein